MEPANGQLPEMTCQELVELVTDYLEGVLLEADRVRFDEHLATCAYCIAYLEQMRVTIALLGRLRDEPLTAGQKRGAG